MITPEILTFAVSTGLGAWIKIQGKRLEMQREQHAQLLAAARVRQAGLAAVRQWVPPGGPWMRRLIVASVLFAVFLAPFVLAAFFPETPVYYAYSETSRGFLFLWNELDRMQFQPLEGYVILPIHTQMASAIAGFYFGAGVAK
jgi:hypothetical protein